jgi:hypothetical protein
VVGSDWVAFKWKTGITYSNYGGAEGHDFDSRLCHGLASQTEQPEGCKRTNLDHLERQSTRQRRRTREECGRGRVGVES